jgi:hypothetical protein
MTQANETKTVPARPTTKDDGRVKIGGGAIHYSDPAPSTKDTGRVKIGGGAISF